MTWAPLEQPAVAEIQAALADLEAVQNRALRNAHREITEAAAKLRDRLQTIAMGGDDEEGGDDV